jgi:two-component system, LytTR family, sensor histidine kinase AlgZ
MDRFKATLTALRPWRRSLPLSAIIATLVGVQVAYMGDALTAIVPLGLGIGFLVLAPWSWRALPWWAYLLVPLPVVALFGVALPYALALGPTYLTDPGSLVVATVVWLVGGWGLGRDIDLELDIEHAQLKSIKTHLDPHFLFNTLNAIAEWCVEDPAVAEDATLRLAAMLRDILDGLERRAWPLARELAVVRDLLELHRIRDPNAFTYSLPEVDGDAEVPPLLLVSLVENAVKHGPRKGHKGPIAVRVSLVPLRLEVENPGTYAPQTPGRGLAMVRQRLALSYGARGQLAISGQDDRTLAVITA